LGRVAYGADVLLFAEQLEKGVGAEFPAEESLRQGLEFEAAHRHARAAMSYWDALQGGSDPARNRLRSLSISLAVPPSLRRAIYDLLAPAPLAAEGETDHEIMRSEQSKREQLFREEFAQRLALGDVKRSLIVQHNDEQLVKALQQISERSAAKTRAMEKQLAADLEAFNRESERRIQAIKEEFAALQGVVYRK
jgi:hypothetical protein